MPTDTDSPLVALLERYNQVEILGRIENLLWLNAGLLAVIALLFYVRLRKDKFVNAPSKNDWKKEVEQAYDKADYETALDILETTKLLYPGSKLVEYWQGRCYFQMQDWEKAVDTFEDLLRREPIYRKAVKDYMAFIEINGLVSGVEGYLANDD